MRGWRHQASKTLLVFGFLLQRSAWLTGGSANPQQQAMMAMSVSGRFRTQGRCLWQKAEGHLVAF